MVLNDFTVEFSITGTNIQDLRNRNLLARQWLWLRAGTPPSILSAADHNQRYSNYLFVIYMHIFRTAFKNVYTSSEK